MSMPQADRTLYEAVEILTRDHQTPVLQRGQYLGTRRDPALIPALRQAIHSNVGGSGSGAQSPAHTRAIIDSNASELYTAITARIRAWARAAGYQRTAAWPPPEDLLRTWHALHRGDTRAHEATLNGWIATLTDLLVDPPRRWSLGEECPACGQRWAHTPDGRVDALSVVEREPAHHSETICRNCNARWDGVDGARALALAIDERHADVEAS